MKKMAKPTNGSGLSVADETQGLQLQAQLRALANDDVSAFGMISDLAKLHFVAARCEVERFLDSHDSEVRRAALQTLAYDFASPDYVEVARDFLETDPDDFC